MLTEIEVTQDLIIQVDQNANMAAAFAYVPTLGDWVEVTDEVRDSAYLTELVEKKLDGYQKRSQ